MEKVKVNFYFKILKESGMALDEYNNPVEVFSNISVDAPETLSEEEYKSAIDQFRAALALQLVTDLVNIVPITVAEYNKGAYDESGNLRPNVLNGEIAVQTPEDGPLGEFNSMAHLLPVEVREDVEGRINDWINGGGGAYDKYIINQVEYARRVAKMMEERKSEQISEESNSENKNL